MGNFKNLRVWQDAMTLTEEVYKITNHNSFQRDFGLMDQLRRAVVAIVSNIAEGDERDSNRQSVYFFQISKGSSAEVITQLNIAHRLGYIDSDKLYELENMAEKIRASLKNLIKARGGANPVKIISWFILSLFLPL
ncbi:MAG TPA: four helix bundle protein [Saprospiraceae bacterium]|nr:four helix bundle protein [Saprospiraceae bacterium]